MDDSPLLPARPAPGEESADRGASDDLRVAADNAPAILFLSDPRGAITYLTRRWQAATGQPVGEALGAGWLQAVHPDDRPLVVDSFRTAHEGREPFAVDFRLRDEGAGHRWVAATGRPLLDAAGNPTGFAGSVLDVDERKRAELALRRAQQVARFLANASVALTDLSEPHAILKRVAGLCVPFFADWCAVDVAGDGFSLERLVVVHGEPRRASIAGEIARRWTPRLDDPAGPGKVLRSGEPELVEQVPESGGVAWAQDADHASVLRRLGIGSYVCVPVRWRFEVRAAVTLSAVAAGRFGPADFQAALDLAHRTSLAIENAELYGQLLEADRRKDEFLAVLSHELRTPLNAIVGWTHVLRDGAADADTVVKAAETIHRNAQAQNHMISDILDVSRIVAGKMRLDVRSVELPAVIEAALETLRPAAQARGVRVETVIDPRAGPISGDPGRLQQVVWNLVSNAIKFVPEKVGRVHVRLEAVNSHVRITVEDNGRGIDPDFLPHVFERFRQFQSSSNRSHHGLGLGLAIVRQLVELHGGSVRAENRGGGGALFTVDLPRRSVAVAMVEHGVGERHPAAEQPLWLGAAPWLGGVRVLVVDDQEDARELLKTVLERCGASVGVAASVDQALECLRAAVPDVVLADIEMPGKSGFDLLRELRALPREQGGLTPTVALTAYAGVSDRVKALRAGFQMHVPKPVQPAELAAVVASLAQKGPTSTH